MFVSKRFFTSSILSIFLLSIQPVAAFDDQGLIEAQADASTEDHYLKGVVFDRTVTQTGFGFYQAFTRLWQSDSAAHSHTLTLRETPTARHGSIIWIETGSKRLHRLSIGFRNQEIDKKAANSLEIVRNSLKPYKLKLP